MEPTWKKEDGLWVEPEINATPEISVQDGSCHETKVPGVPSSMTSRIGIGMLTHSGGVVSSVITSRMTK